MSKELTKEQKQVLASTFGGCGCKKHCVKEQYSPEEAATAKPRGRFTICEVEADELGLTLKEAASDD